jgi:hypothetical protein
MPEHKCYSCGEFHIPEVTINDSAFDPELEEDAKYFCSFDCFYDYEDNYEYFMRNIFPFFILLHKKC